MNRPLNRRGERLYLEDVPVARLVEEFGTPSTRTAERRSGSARSASMQRSEIRPTS